ncbi:hypothetical protein C2G38_2166866 [Gigaspora rosea]|uniref:BTB domain-containing protein n=1 Tax=Gigaspora rosea TaxID=44941 RepID=A0A397VRA2_9GLOM|nr:hypothetical protein C2G38_2166866 [Gigaspora rosea]
MHETMHEKTHKMFVWSRIQTFPCISVLFRAVISHREFDLSLLLATPYYALHITECAYSDGSAHLVDSARVGEPPNAKIFQAHSTILRYRSLYFRNGLVNVDKDKNNIKNVSIHNLKSLSILLENHNAPFIFELMFVAYEFYEFHLKKLAEIHLIEVEARWLQEFITFQENELVEMIYKWKSLTLRNYLPHIHISGDDIIDNVQPYQQILRKDICDDITRKFMSPNRQVSSTIFPSRKILADQKHGTIFNSYQCYHAPMKK